MDLDLMKKLCTLNEVQIHNVLLNIVKKKYKKYWESKEYIMAEGDIPICLLAHIDTVFPTPPALDDFIYDPEKTVLWAPHGSGFDDLAGVYIIMELLLRGYKPHLIFTHGEELGGIGAHELISTHPECPFEECKALIQLDRANEKDCVFYNCDNDIFTRFIENRGFGLAWGTFSDISIIAPTWGIAAVNLSVGYLDEHTIVERLVCKWNDATTEKVAKILDDAGWVPKYLYVPKVIQMKPKSAAPSFTFDMDSCLICGRALTPDVNSHLISNEEFPYCVCQECFDAYYVIDEPDAVPFD